ncbi:hypothetical protein CPB83DRAFT_864194 [Crepidotus variabilis]|uniref:Uncharacterized protein n=1 Tax=Crepidotus variabilis TaxID=179855 RepID=A0A9P6JIT3_9AGAR|nr:hypothetical protein CPB83DRAFT_864194 [Crepidotus variabilis]
MKKFGLKMATVGERCEGSLSSTHGMVITQRVTFVRADNMPAGFPNPAVDDFIEGAREKKVIELLTAHDPAEYVFQTIIG